jgi:hypothetical protein
MESHVHIILIIATIFLLGILFCEPSSVVICFMAIGAALYVAMNDDELTSGGGRKILTLNGAIITKGSRKYRIVDFIGLANAIDPKHVYGGGGIDLADKYANLKIANNELQKAYDALQKSQKMNTKLRTPNTDVFSVNPTGQCKAYKFIANEIKQRPSKFLPFLNTSYIVVDFA